MVWMGTAIQVRRQPLMWKIAVADVNGKKGKGSDAGGFLLGTEDLEVVFEVVADPEGAVDGGADEEPPTGPAVDVVEFLVAVSGEEEREEGVFGAEEEDDGELGECEEACEFEWERKRRDYSQFQFRLRLP